MQTKNVPLHNNNSQSGGLHWWVQKEERARASQRSLERLCGRRCERVPAKVRRNEPLRARDLSNFSGQRDGHVRGERRRSVGNVCEFENCTRGRSKIQQPTQPKSKQ